VSFRAGIGALPVLHDSCPIEVKPSWHVGLEQQRSVERNPVSVGNRPGCDTLPSRGICPHLSRHTPARFFVKKSVEWLDQMNSSFDHICEPHAASRLVIVGVGFKPAPTVAPPASSRLPATFAGASPPPAYLTAIRAHLSATRVKRGRFPAARGDGKGGRMPPLPWEPATTSQAPTETSQPSKLPSLRGPRARGNPHTTSAGRGKQASQARNGGVDCRVALLLAMTGVGGLRASFRAMTAKWGGGGGGQTAPR
jgi:hypothetical protein